MDAKLTQRFFLSAGETNAEQELSLPLLLSKMIDIATAHANAIGVGNPQMEDRGCGWVLSRIAVEMQRYPKVNEEYSLTTWVESYNRHFSERIIEIRDNEDAAIGWARTIWMVLDTTTRESVGLLHLPIDESLILPGLCPTAKQGRHVNVVPSDYSGELPRGTVRATHEPFEYRFKYCDLDYYRHVNTVRYVQLLLNRFSLEDMDSTEVERMEIAFMHECRYGRTVKVLRSDDGLTSMFSLVSDDRSDPSMSARIVRRPR